MGPKTPRPPDDILARGGGNATAAGVNFEAKLGAWLASQLIAERPLDARLTGRRILSLRFETEAPVDDILAETDRGWIFFQAKTTLTMSSSSQSEIAKIADQFVRQWLACTTGDGGRGWNRPLRPEVDRLVLALGAGTSRSISIDLAQGLSALQMSESTPLSESKAAAVQTFNDLLVRAWKTVTGQQSSRDDIRSILNLVSILTFDLDGSDRQTATEILSHVIDRPLLADAAFSTLTLHCFELMQQRTGYDMHGLRRALVARGIPLFAPPSYRADIASLRAYSEHVRSQLSDYEATKVAGTQIRIERQCTNAIVKAARAGSLLLVGEPGTGKSAVINASAEILRNEGNDVLELAVDRLPVKSLPDLAAELGLSHPLRDVLLNWSGDKPAFLFIDALDATRGGKNEAVFKTLIADVISFEARQWHVIASIRSFDLRLGEQFKQLFSGRPPNEEFADSAFSNVVHIHVPPWTPTELGKLLQDAPNLSAAIDAGGERLRELAIVPFNTRLLADLISGGLAPVDFRDIQSQVQLLGLYWNNRIERHGTGAELCLEAAVAQMIESRSLRARKLDTARPDPSAFDALLHENVLVLLPQDQFVSFRHHILFDYGASRVYLRPDDLVQTSNILKHDKGLGLMLAPALGFALQQLWNDAECGHQRFWDAITRFSGDPSCDPVARSVAARTASELPRVSGDAIGLLSGLTLDAEPKTRAALALSHVVGALIVRLEDKQQVSLDPWCELAEQASGCAENTAWPLWALLYALFERVDSEIHRAKLGLAARRLLAYCLDSAGTPTQLTGSAIDFVAATYSSDINASRQLLRRLFEPEHFQDHADQEIPRLARRLRSISEADSDFVVEIYAGAFGASITDKSITSIGQSQILSLLSNRRQDYESSWWSLKEFFPTFLKAHPIHGVRALINATAGYVARAHPLKEDARVWTIPISDGTARLQEDQSYIWAWNVDEEHRDCVHGLIKAYANFLEISNLDVARAMIQEIIKRNELGVIWSRTLMASSKRAQDVGDLLWPIATQEPFLTSLDTQKDAIDFIAARYPFEGTATREVFERTAMDFRFEQARQPEKALRKVLATLFTCVGEQYLSTNEAREHVLQVKTDDAPRQHNPRPFSIVTGSGSPEKWWWLKNEGVDIKDHRVYRILTEIEEVKVVLELENREDKIDDITLAIIRVNTLIEMAGTKDPSLPEPVTAYAYGVAAQATAKLSRLPVECLREQSQTLPSLIRLVILLSKIPSEPAGAEEEENFESSASWGSPNAPVDTAEALMQLCRVDSSIVDQLCPTMEMLLSSRNPAARLRIAESLTLLWNSARSLMWELAGRVARTEQNRGVLKFFANYFLNRTIHADPERVEQLAFNIHERDFNRSDESTRSLFEEIGSLIALLWISHGRDRPRYALQAWIADPHTFEAELGHAIAVSREALVLKYLMQRPADVDITNRAQEFCSWAVASMADGLEHYLNDIQSRLPTDAEKERGTLYAKLLNQLCDQIYYASGAFQSNERDPAPLGTDEAKRCFLLDMWTMLDRIADSGTPGTIHHLMELLHFLVPADPARVFDLVSHALLGAGRRHSYQFESLAVERFVEIVGLYLADYRELFSDEQRRQKLITCLDLFMEAGWPAARRLLYRLPELLQ